MSNKINKKIYIDFYRQYQPDMSLNEIKEELDNYENEPWYLYLQFPCINTRKTFQEIKNSPGTFNYSIYRSCSCTDENILIFLKKWMYIFVQCEEVVKSNSTESIEWPGFYVSKNNSKRYNCKKYYTKNSVITIYKTFFKDEIDYDDYIRIKYEKNNESYYFEYKKLGKLKRQLIEKEGCPELPDYALFMSLDNKNEPNVILYTGESYLVKMLNNPYVLKVLFPYMGTELIIFLKWLENKKTLKRGRVDLMFEYMCEILQYDNGSIDE